MMRLRAFLAAGFALLAAPVLAQSPAVITKAEYAEPTARYDHGILGDALEWGALILRVDMCKGCDVRDMRRVTLRLPQSRVFEDIAPRLVALSGRDGPVAMVVETDLKRGARLALYDEGGLIAATPFIGRTHRWLAPIGAADLDGDGQVEFAYVDRPHLAKTIRIWRYVEGSKDLLLVAELPGFTNHRIGWDHIPGGIRDCGAGPEMVVADADMQSIYAVSFRGGAFSASRTGPNKGRVSFERALACNG